MKRHTIIAFVVGLSLSGCAALTAAGNAALGVAQPQSAAVVTTVQLDAVKGLFAAEATVDTITVAAGEAASAGLIKGATASKVLALVDKAHGYIEAAHAGVTLGNDAAIAANAQAAINTAYQAKALTPNTALATLPGQ